MLQISEIVKKTEEMFDLLNEHFYNKELTRPAITVSPDGGRGAYGWCSIHEIWNADEEKYREINLCAEYLDRPMAELAATLLHEMAHLYNLEHDIQDVSNNGYYHNMMKYTILLMVILNSLQTPEFMISIALLIFAVLSIIVGFWKRKKGYRLYGLVLSMLSIFKLIMLDANVMKDAITGSVSFIICGLLCFAISFIYNKIQKEYFDDTKN